MKMYIITFGESDKYTDIYLGKDDKNNTIPLWKIDNEYIGVHDLSDVQLIDCIKYFEDTAIDYTISEEIKYNSILELSRKLYNKPGYNIYNIIIDEAVQRGIITIVPYMTSFGDVEYHRLWQAKTIKPQENRMTIPTKTRKIIF